MGRRLLLRNLSKYLKIKIEREKDTNYWLVSDSISILGIHLSAFFCALFQKHRHVSFFFIGGLFSNMERIRSGQLFSDWLF
jgi:hypothetical protein